MLHSFAGVEPGVLVDIKLNGSLQCAHATGKARGVLGCFGQSIASRWSEVVLPVSSDG